MMLKKLTDEFAVPGSTYRSKPFWAWSGTLEPEELRRQINVFQEMGFGGFFMHSRVGLATEYLSDKWFECIEACVAEAETLGMEAWIYDEDRWPSGVAGGLVTKKPEYRMRYLAMEQIRPPEKMTWQSDILAAFQARIDGVNAYDVQRIEPGRQPVLSGDESVLVFQVKTAPLTGFYNGYTYLDTLSEEAVGEFIKITHEAYRKKVGSHFGKTVPGIFTDEPQHGSNFADIQETNDGKSLAWTPGLPELFRTRYGYDIADHLPELFLNVNGEPITPARHNYHDCTTFLFTRAFSGQIGRWCKENNLLFTG
ncbi:MAG: hypothetical protein KAH24_10280, partial [Holophagae bacterium]|nr:hypothetical protein [Holophagae bacterium]